MSEIVKKNESFIPKKYVRNISDEMRTSFLEYSMSVIVSRALPDARDGLKPVHRRILYSLAILGMTHDKPYKKAARIVGECIGKFHPHGDIAVYETMVRMAQEFNYRYPLADGQGNFGSIDGDSAAAMRYTEVRMSKIAGELVKDLNKNTVTFVENYDGAEKEPSVLPAYFPNLLVNGTTGIAVGMATSIPPHNLREIVDAIIFVAQNPECDIMEILDIVKGPDFPTGAMILGVNSFKNAYLNGRSTIIVRSKTKVEKLPNGKPAIIVEEIPYQSNKTNLINNIVKAVQEKKVNYITDLRDESNREGIRLVLEIKNIDYAELILNQLYKFTSLQTTFTINLLALDNKEPKVMNLKEMIEIYIDHQIKIIFNKSNFELNKYEHQFHIIFGLVKALKNIDEIIKIIKESKKSEEALTNLRNKFEFSEKQAKAILEMKLQRLTDLEQEKLNNELTFINEEIIRLKTLINEPSKQIELMISQLVTIKENYGDDRRTEIIENYEGEIIDEALIKEEQVVITLSKSGYIKRLPLDTYRTQNRGGVGIKGAGGTDINTDDIDKILITSTHSDLLIFSNKGKVYRIRAHKVPNYSRVAKGTPIVNLIATEKNEDIKTIIAILDDYDVNANLFFVTKKGIIKRSALEQFKSIYQNGKIAIKLRANDQLVDVLKTTGNDEIIIAVANGRAVRINENQVRIMSRIASGVKGIDTKGTYVIGICSNQNGNLVMSISDKGYGKISIFEEYRLSNRGGKGVISMKLTEKTGKLIGINSINNISNNNELLIITLKGTVIRFSLEDIRTTSRNTIGVKLLRFKTEDDAISSIMTIPITKEKTIFID
ncbi:DNA topoisomerase (ATP-hydrolyzing) subunit A [Spiroplasma endosymbiont of Polydrusus pterygomalis]|uniref:DNA topoisomerase (ATP-hydrolyzing) subunit A n=1 Tax=Spiroplasma endosymbiont of Polydrusus pterygomalis TaxID=3139327 RepID=UPI003CCB67CD